MLRLSSAMLLAAMLSFSAHARAVCSACAADLDGDGIVSIADVSLFSTLYDAGDGRADCDSDGVVSPADVSRYSQLYDGQIAECPAPLSWDDASMHPLSSESAPYFVSGGGWIDRASFHDEEPVDPASVTFNYPGSPGLARATHVQIRSDEGLRFRGDTGGDALVEWAYVEITPLPGDHADGAQGEGNGDPTGDVTLRHTYIKMNGALYQTAGFFSADGRDGAIVLEDVVFDRGPYGLAIACDGASSLSLDHVYFISGSFRNAGYRINDGIDSAPACAGHGVSIVRWQDVYQARIVDGKLVVLDAVPSPCGQSTCPDTVGVGTDGLSGAYAQVPTLSPMASPVVAASLLGIGRRGLRRWRSG